MARKYEFKPDKPRSGFWSKLILTRQQRRSLLRWGLYALVLLVLSVLQDVILCRFRLFGATTELVPCAIFLICLTEGLEKGCLFSLIASCLYLFSGTAAGPYTIVFITASSVGVTMFRQSMLQKSFSSTMLCCVMAMFAYKLAVFFIGLFLSLTTWGHIGSFLLAAFLSLVFAPVLYKVITAISTIGGESWKE